MERRRMNACRLLTVDWLDIARVAGPGTLRRFVNRAGTSGQDKQYHN